MANILCICVKYPVASGRYMTDAFRRLGHSVYVLGPETGNKVWGIEVNPKYAWREPFIPPGWKPDLVITMDTNYNPIVNYDCPHVIYSVDNHVRDVKHDSAYPHYDKYFLAHHDGPARPVCEDCGHIWLPCGYDDLAFTPSPIPMAERKYDVACVGYPYERRQRIVSLMQDAGLNVYAGLGPLYEEYRDIYHNAKISLCVSAAGDVAQRVFETAAMGCVILSDPLMDATRLYMQPFNSTVGMGFCTHYEYTTDEGAVNIAKTILADPVGLLAMAGDISKNWARPHTWIARVQTILETMGVK